jgi:hypothetical protein
MYAAVSGSKPTKIGRGSRNTGVGGGGVAVAGRGNGLGSNLLSQ